MPAELKDINFYKTTAGLGGAITATKIRSQSVSLSLGIAGVSVLDAADALPGTGTLRYVGSTKAFYYTPPSGVEGVAVVPVGTGEIIVRGSGANAGYLRLSITLGSLPGTNVTSTATIAHVATEVFDDVTKQEALDGRVEYRCVYLKNDAATSLLGAALWINADTIGGDSISVGLDPAGVGATATTIGAETTVPGGVVFSQPLSEAAALVVATMTAGQSFAFWIARTVPVGTVTSVANDYSWLRFRILV